MPTPLSKVRNARRLSDYLFGNERESNFDSQPKKFWPENVLESLRDENVIRRVLTIEKSPPDDELVSFIEKRAIRLFAISATVFSESSSRLLQAMQTFNDSDFGDEKLSEKIKASDATLNYSTWLREKLAALDGCEDDAESKAGADDDEESEGEDDDDDSDDGTDEEDNKASNRLWHETNRRRFDDDQWKALIPVFSTQELDYNFRTSTILPFLTKETNKDRRGAFSKVYKVSIHPNHFIDKQVPENERPPYFAIKEILPPTVEEEREVADKWGNEAKRLREMNRRNKKHIVHFINAFKRGDDFNETSYFLMFEWADGGSLENIWQKYPKSVANADVVKDAISQMLGLAEALVTTHNAMIRHGDLKPQNILCFLDRPNSLFGTLKIGDWGLAKYHNVMTRSRQVGGQNTATKWGTALYEAPEADSMLGPRILSRQYDVWSMGCIFLEFIIWLLYGYEGIIRFRQEVQGNAREPVSFYRVVPGNPPRAVLHEAVIKWMDHLELVEVACAKGTALGEILTLIREHILLIRFHPLNAATFNDEASGPLRKLSTSSQGPPPEVRSTLQVGNPEVVVTPGDRLEESSQSISPGKRPGPGLLPEMVIVSSDGDTGLPLASDSSSSFRSTSLELWQYLSDIYHNDDEQDGFWFQASPPGTPRRLPPKPAERSYQDEKGLLTAPFLQKERLPPLKEANLVPGMKQLSVQAPIIDVRESTPAKP